MKSTDEATGYDANGDLKHNRQLPLNRRELLGSLAIIAGALAAPSAHTLSIFADNTISNLAIRVASALGFKETFDFGHIGGEEAVSALLSDILNLSIIQRSSISLSDAQVKQRINAQTALDYSRNDMVNVEGWWISITEARCLKLVGAIETVRS